MSTHPIHLAHGALTAEILPLGATLRSLTFEGVELLLRLPDLAAYETDGYYLNPIIGRCANRVAYGRFEIDGETFHVSTNEGPNTLHGGTRGWNRAEWTLIDQSDTAVRLAHASPHGDMGFPGTVHAEVAFTLHEHDALEIVWSATADRATPVNLTHHLYFNLSGDDQRSILDHTLHLTSGAFTPVGDGLIPTGEIAPVDATPFDFRAPRRIGDALAQPHPQLEAAGGLDMNFALDPAMAGPALRLHSPESGIVLEIETDQPGLQLYGGQGLKPPFVKHGALAIEPQGFPDAPNHPNFPGVILQPHEHYQKRALYRFRRERG